MTPDEGVKMLREIAMEDTKASRELGVKFFFHWAILSGTALTLLVPFLSSEQVQKNITSGISIYIIISIFTLTTSLIFASIRNFIMMHLILNLAKIHHNTANKLNKAIKEKSDFKSDPPKEKFKVVLIVVQYIAILSFIIGVIATSIIIFKVII